MVLEDGEWTYWKPEVEGKREKVIFHEMHYPEKGDTKKGNRSRGVTRSTADRP